MKQQTQKAADRRHDIANAALTCLAKGGYASLTARKVAAEADLSLGHITYHFSGMDEVLAAAYRLACATLRQAEGPPDAPPTAKLHAFLATGLPDTVASRDLALRIDLWSAALHHPAVTPIERALYADDRAQLERHLLALASPRRRAKASAVADLIMAALDGLRLDWQRRGDAAAAQNIIALCLKLAQSELQT